GYDHERGGCLQAVEHQAIVAAVRGHREGRVLYDGVGAELDDHQLRRAGGDLFREGEIPVDAGHGGYDRAVGGAAALEVEAQTQERDERGQRRAGTGADGQAIAEEDDVRGRRGWGGWVRVGLCRTWCGGR